MTSLTRARLVGLLALGYLVLLVLLTVFALVGPLVDFFQAILAVLAHPASLVMNLLPLNGSLTLAVLPLTLSAAVLLLPLWWFGKGRPRAAAGRGWAADESVTELTGRYRRGASAFWVSAGYGVFCAVAIGYEVIHAVTDGPGFVNPVLFFGLLPSSLLALLLGNAALFLYAYVVAAVMQVRLLWVLLRGRRLAVDLPEHLRS
ncbi:hypothetical protein [Nonomuraea rhizosphaerae]|uniref:hypothetical protein n=1 Tax=Nonomuraea rhizosphaerae TaxID=2665663 RepID=UPI001C5E5ABB|nr:hypothetical protein [Nonomuraea rhizosphaerae]